MKIKLLCSALLWAGCIQISYANDQTQTNKQSNLKAVEQHQQRERELKQALENISDENNQSSSKQKNEKMKREEREQQLQAQFEQQNQNKLK